MANTPLYNALAEHIGQGKAPFHTPGHKGADFLKNLIELDLTELPGTDSLYTASGAILKAEQEAARLFDAKCTLFSAGGCSLAIWTMLRLAAPQGGKVICSRALHVSAVNAMAFLDIEPCWILPDENGRVQAKDIESALVNNLDAKAVYITSPDYYGRLSDIEAIAKVCEGYGVPLLVDNAHGSHLKFAGDGLHPLEQGAAMTADSAHKTLPVLTSGAWLHIKDSRFIPHAKEAMSLFGSTSPSYPVMASLDLCRAWLESNGKEAFAKLKEQVDKVKKAAISKGIVLPKSATDPVRLALDTSKIGLKGHQAAELLRRGGVEPEFADERYVVLIPSPFNTDLDFVRLLNVIKSLPVSQAIKVNPYVPSLPKKEMTLRQAIMAKSEVVSTAKANGRIAAQAVFTCPPGVPLTIPGEKINKKSIEFLLKYGISTVKVVK